MCLSFVKTYETNIIFCCLFKLLILIDGRLVKQENIGSILSLLLMNEPYYWSLILKYIRNRKPKIFIYRGCILQKVASVLLLLLLIFCFVLFVIFLLRYPSILNFMPFCVLIVMLSSFHSTFSYQISCFICKYMPVCALYLFIIAHTNTASINDCDFQYFFFIAQPNALNNKIHRERNF